MKKKLFPVLLSLLAILGAAAALPAQESRTVRVPEGNGKPILIDGLFTPGEWDDALKIEIRPDIHLLLKKSAGFVFIGIRYLPYKGSIVDLFLSPDAKALHHFHVSAQLGERLLNDTPGLDDDPEFVWGDTSGWYANEIRWNGGKVQALVKEGKNPYAAQNESLYAYDGFEFQIRESKLGGGILAPAPRIAVAARLVQARGVPRRDGRGFHPRVDQIIVEIKTNVPLRGRRWPAERDF